MAKQMILSFDVDNQTLKRKDENKIVEKSKNYVHAIFFFTEEWDDTQKAAIIENGGMRFKVYLENNECDIPNRAVSHDGFTITIVGEDEEKNITITTTDLFIAVQKNNASDIQEEYIKNITSDTLDVEKENETCNLEIKDEEKLYYEMQENDFSNTQHESGNQWSLDLSETLKNVITEFKKRIGVDWEKLGLRPPVSDMPKCVYTPTKKVISVLEGEEITNYVLSAVDSYGDTSVYFHYQNDSWHVTFTTDNFVNTDLFNERTSQLENQIAEKSKVVANPTLSGNEETLEGAEIDGIKYKVGGDKKLYQHSIKMIGTGAVAGDRLVILNILSYSDQPKTWNDVKTYCTNLQQATGWASAGGENRSIHSVKTAENANRLFVYYGSDSVYAFMPEPTSLTDTITEVE